MNTVWTSVSWCPSSHHPGHWNQQRDSPKETIEDFVTQGNILHTARLQKWRAASSHACNSWHSMWSGRRRSIKKKPWSFLSQQTLTKVLQLTFTETREPTTMFLGLKLNISTFLALIWIHFGDKCHLYVKLYQVYNSLHLSWVSVSKGAFMNKAYMHIDVQYLKTCAISSTCCSPQSTSAMTNQSHFQGPS